MRNDVVFRVYGIHAGREEDTYLGAFKTVAEAESQIETLRAREMNGRNWAEQYHSLGFVIREVRVQTDFEIPPRPKPRDCYFARGTPKSYGLDRTPGSLVEVFRRDGAGGEPKKVCDFERNYGLLHAFEPFRQGDREFALISPHYTGTAVLDLSTGRVIAEEPESSNGFCPVGFYVPDWWDVNDGSVIPGSEYWNADYEWPNGEFGFVWGCIWGDDSSWKVQYLDLSGIRSGVIRREERFGYVELSTANYKNSCIALDGETPAPSGSKPPFIILERWEGKTKVTFAVEMEFELSSGQPTDWKRHRNSRFE